MIADGDLAEDGCWQLTTRRHIWLVSFDSTLSHFLFLCVRRSSCLYANIVPESYRFHHVEYWHPAPSLLSLLELTWPPPSSPASPLSQENRFSNRNQNKPFKISEYITPCFKSSNGFPALLDQKPKSGQWPTRLSMSWFLSLHEFFFLFNCHLWPIPSGFLAVLWNDSCASNLEFLLCFLCLLCLISSTPLPSSCLFSNLTFSLRPVWVKLLNAVTCTISPHNLTHSPCPFFFMYLSLWHYLCLFKMAYYQFLLHPYPDLSSMNTGIFVRFVHWCLQKSRLEPSTWNLLI